MPVILPVKNISPSWGNDCFIAPNATIVGDVEIGDNCSIWFNAVIRGDVHYIKIGNNTNIQDGACIHCTYMYAPTHIGNNVSIGHNALVHGCTLKDNVLIGMGAIVMDHAIVEEYVIIAAGSVVLEKTIGDRDRAALLASLHQQLGRREVGIGAFPPGARWFRQKVLLN